MKPEFERVKTLLSDTVQLLCKSSLTFKELYIEGLLCITVDNDTFCMHLSDRFGDADLDRSSTENSAPGSPAMGTTPQKHETPVKRKRDSVPGQEEPPLVRVKTEALDDDLVLVEPKQEFQNTQRHHRPPPSRVPPLHGTDSDSNFSNYDNSLGYSGSPSRHSFGGAVGDMAARAAQNVMAGNNLADQGTDQDAGCSTWGSGDTFGGMDAVSETPQLDLDTCLARLNINPEEFQNAMQMSTYKTDPAAFMLNKLIDLSFTKEELASAKGLGLRGEGRWQQGAGLDPDKVTAIKDATSQFCVQTGVTRPSSKRMHQLMKNKQTNARQKLRRLAQTDPQTEPLS